MRKKINQNTDIMHYSSNEEVENQNDLLNLMNDSPIPKNQVLSNLGLFLDSKNLSRILFMDYIYKKIIDTQGVVMEFGTRWGQNSALFTSLRGIYEPYNRHRKIVAFDTFSGFPKLNKKDGKSSLMQVGQLNTSKGYEKYLSKIIHSLERSNPINHIKKYEIVKGNAEKSLKQYLIKNPETIISLAYFDFDIYEPTKKCLELILPHLSKGSILGFDELNDPDSPGETLAVNEVFGLNNIRLKRYQYCSRVSYFIVE